MDAGRQWFLHAIYNVHSPHASRSRRSIEYNVFAAATPQGTAESYKLRHKRALQDVADIGDATGKGTNLVRIVTKVKSPKADAASVDLATGGVTHLKSSEPGSNVYQVSMITVISLLLLLLLLLLFLVLCRRPRHHNKKAESYGNATAVSIANGNVEVVNTKYTGKDASEV